MGDIKVTFPKPCLEIWDDMTPDGRNRFCARCEKTVFDLSSLTINEAEALLNSERETCVRARVDSNGTVAVKMDPDQSVRKMVLAMGASVSLLTTGCQTYGNDRAAGGAISGQVDGFYLSSTGYVTATDDAGTVYRSPLKANGEYKIRNVPPGTYSLRFTPDCGDPWIGDSVIVQDRRTTVSDAADPNDCIIVGRIEIEQKFA